MLGRGRGHHWVTPGKIQRMNWLTSMGLLALGRGSEAKSFNHRLGETRGNVIVLPGRHGFWTNLAGPLDETH